MIIKMPKTGKAERIRGLLSYWNPLDMNSDPMFYNYEAEVLSQSVRKNSRPEKISKLVHDLIQAKMIEEGVTLEIDQGSCDRIAVAMIETVKNC